MYVLHVLLDMLYVCVTCVAQYVLFNMLAIVCIRAETGSGQHHSITDPDDPLTRIVIWVRPRYDPGVTWIN